MFIFGSLGYVLKLGMGGFADGWYAKEEDSGTAKELLCLQLLAFAKFIRPAAFCILSWSNRNRNLINHIVHSGVLFIVVSVLLVINNVNINKSTKMSSTSLLRQSVKRFLRVKI